jgi:hypothetical protein
MRCVAQLAIPSGFSGVCAFAFNASRAQSRSGQALVAGRQHQTLQSGMASSVTAVLNVSRGAALGHHQRRDPPPLPRVVTGREARQSARLAALTIIAFS